MDDCFSNHKLLCISFSQNLSILLHRNSTKCSHIFHFTLLNPESKIGIIEYRPRINELIMEAYHKLYVSQLSIWGMECVRLDR